MEAKRFGSLVCSSVALLCLAGQCDPPVPGLTPPADAVPMGTDARGVRVYETGYENPLVAGNVPLDLQEFTVERSSSPSPLYGDVVTYRGSTLVNLRIGSRLEPAFLDIDRAPINLRFNMPFAGPGLSLVPDAPSLLIRVETLHQGSSPPFSEFVTRVDQIRYTMRPDVLIVPVRALVFARPDDSLPYLGGDARTATGIVSQLFDTAGSQGNRLGTSEGYWVTASQYEHFSAASPDALWHQCGIQFHLDGVEVVDQNDGLERVLVASDNPCNFDFTEPPLREYLRRLADLRAVPLFVGGSINESLIADDLGISCFSRHTDAFVAITGLNTLTAGILAHELGHVLGQDHTRDPANLMTPPDLVTRSIRGTELTPDQCAFARCMAKRLLTAFERPVPAAAEDACVSFDPLCGNGIREAGEECDDGNAVSGDGCRPNCISERCGDGIVDPPREQCDYNDPAGQSENCDAKCQLCDACNVCGDGILGPTEQCDDGNTDPHDKCDNECHSTIF